MSNLTLVKRTTTSDKCAASHTSSPHVSRTLSWRLAQQCLPCAVIMENAFKGAIKTKHKFGALNWQQWYPSYSNLRTNKQDIAEKICSSGNSTDTFQRFCCAVLFVRMVAANVGHCQETCLGDLIASWSHHWNANVHTDRNILVLACTMPRLPILHHCVMEEIHYFLNPSCI